jgi:putative endonuclease
MSISGQTGEDLACRHYQGLGYQLLDRNYTAPFGKQTGELDLVFRKDREIVFVEVKARSNNKFGGPFEAVNWSKQRKLVKTVKMYMRLHPQFIDFDYRIDVAAVDIDNVIEPVIILLNAIEDLD